MLVSCQLQGLVSLAKLKLRRTIAIVLSTLSPLIFVHTQSYVWLSRISCSYVQAHVYSSTEGYCLCTHNFLPRAMLEEPAQRERTQLSKPCALHHHDTGNNSMPICLSPDIEGETLGEELCNLSLVQ